MTAGRTRLNRGVAGLGLLALAATANTLVPGELDAFRLRGAGIAVMAGLGLLAVLAGWFGWRLLAVAVGVGFLAAAAIQFVQLGGELGAIEGGILDGTASAVAAWLGLGVGITILGVIQSDAPEQTSDPEQTSGTVGDGAVPDPAS